MIFMSVIKKHREMIIDARRDRKVCNYEKKLT